MGLALGDKGSPAGPASPGQAAQCPAGGHSLGALGTVGPTPGLSVEVRPPPGLSIPAPWTQQRAGAPGCLWKEAQGGGPGTSDTFLSQLGPQSLQDGGRGRGRAPGGCSVPGGFLPTHSPSTSDSHPWQASGVGVGSLPNQAHPPVPGKQRITAKLSGADSTPPACLGKETPTGLSSRKPPGSSVPGRPTHSPTPAPCMPLPPSRSQSPRCRGSHCWRGQSPGGPMSPGEAEARGGPSVLGSCEAPCSRGLLVYKDPWFGL